MASNSDPKKPYGIHSLDHFCLEVPDTSVGARFFSDFGLDVRKDGAEAVELRTCGSDHVWGRLVPGDRRHIAYLSFGCYASDLPELERVLADVGIVPSPPHPTAQVADGIWFSDPNGLKVQVRVGDKVTPAAPPQPKVPAATPGVRAVGVGGRQKRSRPLRFSHILIFVPDVIAAVSFYERVLGLKLSDSTGDVIAFTHAIHGSDHHLLAFAKAAQLGLHHTSWVMDSVEDVGVATAQMKSAGYVEGWGVGRHVLGSNYFSYIRDPWGSWAEYGYGIDHIPSGTAWEPVSLRLDDPLNVWGPDMPANFIENFT